MKTTCPKCAYVREPSDNLVPDWQCPKCGVVYAKYTVAARRRVLLSLTSSNEVSFSEIKLHERKQLMELEDLRRSIDQNFRGFSTGLGFIGDLEDVVVASVVKGAVEGLISAPMAAKARAQLTEAAALAKKIRESGTFVSVSTVENIHLPQTDLWRSFASVQGLRKELVQAPTKYITVNCDGHETNIFWDKVEQYKLIADVSPDPMS